MTKYVLLAVALAAGPERALAEWMGLRAFDAPNVTWKATHIVLVEDEKVVESWKGDLNPGAKLPEGAAAYARIRPPRLDPDWLKRSGEKHPPVTGKRMVLFLEAFTAPSPVAKKGKSRHDAWWLLCQTGDAGVDAVLKVLDDQVGYWKGAAERLKPGQAAGDLPDNPLYPWAGNGLYHLLEGVCRMRLSTDNQRRVREHRALAELDRLLEAHPVLKVGLVRMDAGHRRLKDIRAGYFVRPDD